MKQTVDVGAHFRAARFLDEHGDAIAEAVSRTATPARPCLLAAVRQLLDLSVRGVTDDLELTSRARLAARRRQPPLGDLLAAASALVDAAVAHALATMGDEPDVALLPALCQILNRATTRALLQSGASHPARIPGQRPFGDDVERVPVRRSFGDDGERTPGQRPHGDDGDRVPGQRTSGVDGERMPVAERSRVARELHDRIGQSVEIAYRNLEIHEITTGSAGEPDRRISAAQHALRDALHGIRAIISNVRESHVREPVRGESLAAELGRYVSSVSHYDVDVRFAVRGEEGQVPSALLDEVFVVVREALHNAVRHAAAAKVEARIDIEPTELRACVLDDGVGFDLGERRWAGGVGLGSMTERATAAGGSVMIDSVPGIGTRVELSIPLVSRAACAVGLRP